MPLTAEQLRAFETEGFAVGARLLDDSQLGRLRGEFDAMIAGLPPSRRPENMPSVHYDNAYLRTFDRDTVSPTKFDWHGVRLYHARGARGARTYWN